MVTDSETDEEQTVEQLREENARLRGELDIATANVESHGRTIAELKSEVAALRRTIRACRTLIANIKNQRNELRDKLFDYTVAEKNAGLHDASAKARPAK